MKRIALVLAAAFFGTGCIFVDDDPAPDCDQRDVTVTWSRGFTGPDPVANRSCAAAGVSFVDLFLDDAQVVGPIGNGHFACGDLAVTILGVPRGSHTLTTEGVDADGATILYRDDRPLAASGCGDFSVSVEPAAGFVDLEYLFYAGGTLLDPQVCAGAYLWLSIHDEIANTKAVLADAGAGPTAYTCGGAFGFALPVGSYTLEWMEERGTGPGYALESADCTDRFFTVGARAATPVPVNLDVNAGACVRQ